MYRYNEHDSAFVQARAAEFRDQVSRRLTGKLSEDEFRPLRLMNGLYLQLHAYMLRVAIPYGVLSAEQLRTLALLARRYDRGYGHFTTRQNIQYNWPKLEDVPDMLDQLAAVGMHAIQTSGNCIRNVTSDPFAGVAADENIDPRPTAELLRQWSSLHPEFAYLPRKFKFAVTGAAEDRAAIKLHDIGLQVKADPQGAPLYNIWVGGGQGRTPRVAQLIYNDVQLNDLLPTLDSMLRVYNLEGRRDNKYKARIKILIAEKGLDEYRAAVDADRAAAQSGAAAEDFVGIEALYDRIAAQFITAPLPVRDDRPLPFGDDAFSDWVRTNIAAHKAAGYAIVSISLKPPGGVPGDATDQQMEHIADLAERYSAGEVRVTHRQNLVLPHVAIDDLRSLYAALVEIGFETPNIGQASDIIACPGLDYCSLATARSIPVAQVLSQRLRAREAQDALGPMSLNISGCINACGHHHVANIGILGLNRAEKENYQITLGGRSDAQAVIGDVMGPGFTQDEVPAAIDRVLDCYLQQRKAGERFADTYQRVGKAVFKGALYVES